MASKLAQTKQQPSQQTKLHPNPRTSLLKILGFILLVGSVTLITFQSAMIAIASWS